MKMDGRAASQDTRQRPTGTPVNFFREGVGILRRPSLLSGRGPFMKLVSGVAGAAHSANVIETLILSDAHADYLDAVSRALNPDMPAAFGWPHAIRAILDCFEESGIDLTAARNEEELVLLAAGGLRGRHLTERSRFSARSSSCRVTRSEDRPETRASQPAKDRCRSGRRPRSDRG